MDVTAVVVIAATVFAWGTVSARVTRADLTAPIVFVAVGGSLVGLGLIERPSTTETLKTLVELALVWVLFSDAAGVPMKDLRHDVPTYVRLLAIGLPLTVLAGWGLGQLLFPELGLWLALLVGAALAPTDAALGLPVVKNVVVPARVRELITVESGLNDGIVTPIVMVALAGAAADAAGEVPGLGEALAELALGAGVGAACGFGGGWVLRRARRRGWVAEEFTGIAVLALALLAYAAALSLHGNGFVAAFCAGLAFGAAAGPRGSAELVFLEQASDLVSLVVWLTFGALAVPVLLDRVDAAVLLYAVLSLTLVRMVPVALALTGSGLDRRTVLFIGWFGPRGLASLVFALLALDELGADAERLVAVIGATVLLSILAHGLSAGPLATRYGRAAARSTPTQAARATGPGPDGAA
jgi:NhaP-type Na+/H+ or K+/H+ antiporter